MHVQDVMSTAIESAAPGDSAEQAWTHMQVRGIHHLIVMDGRRVVGIISERNLGGPGGSTARQGRTVADLMNRHVVTATPEMPLRRAANLLRGRSIGCLPVVRGDELVGILTTSDVLETIGRGVQKPIVLTRRATLATRGPRRKPAVPQR